MHSIDPSTLPMTEEVFFLGVLLMGLMMILGWRPISVRLI